MVVDAREGRAPARPPIWNDPRFRAIFFQVLVIGGVLLFILYIINNTLDNMASRGIASGFAFLDKTAGFSIGMTLIDYEEANTYGRAFVVGLLNTLLVSAIGVVIATFLGFFIGIARLSSNWLVARIATVYIETLRNIPLLLQIFYWYFAVLRPLPNPKSAVSILDMAFLHNRGLTVPKPIFEPGFSLVAISIAVAIVAVIFVVRWARRRQQRTGEQFHSFYVSLGILIGLPLLASIIAGFPLTWEYPELEGFNFQGGTAIMPELVALTLALSTYTAAFIAENVRSGILAVSHGQTEAAYSIGLRPGVTLRLVVIPQALRVIIPPLTSQYLNLTKNSSLAAAIAYPDLVMIFAGTSLMQTGQAVEIMAITMLVYLCISLMIATIMNWYNKVTALVER